MLWGLMRPTFPVRLRMDDSYCEKDYTIEYANFNGSPSEDVEYFLRDFEAIAQYNEQVSDEDKLRTLPNLLKERALSWIKKKPDESIRKYSIKLTRLINQLQSVDEPYPERLKVWWYLKGLPTSICKYCLQAGNNSTLEAAISIAKTYEATAKTPRQELHGRGTERSDDADADADASSEISDLESCTSMGTFISSIAESVDLRSRNLAPRKIHSSPSRRKALVSSRESKTSIRTERPSKTVVKREAAKLCCKSNDRQEDVRLGTRLDRRSASIQDDIERLTRGLHGQIYLRR
ncbi:hypothetical protein AXG93_406s1450 [Marchantia polymorpha subsp. ruderalis]|uniref:Retrotransposon gag domain-containing protein n=1 Tax=Marchantia polymorpha subsp. ruderalis TaxID=1480154 RepID=A0A176VC85_MARPO|nr:hypothetical protein AXG93_406s1450 [Marchantia polymorpha subsp. ruderalis]